MGENRYLMINNCPLYMGFIVQNYSLFHNSWLKTVVQKEVLNCQNDNRTGGEVALTYPSQSLETPDKYGKVIGIEIAEMSGIDCWTIKLDKLCNKLQTKFT